jgi:hypothetical protein
MPYVLRTPDGLIDSVHRQPVPGADFIAADSRELRQLLGHNGAGRPGDAFASLDAGLIRVLEDLVDVLVARNVINITDLPGEAQHKLFARKNFRDRFGRNALDLGMATAETTGVAGLPAAVAVRPARRRR